MPIIYSLRRRIKELYEKKSEVKCIMWQHEIVSVLIYVSYPLILPRGALSNTTIDDTDKHR